MNNKGEKVGLRIKHLFLVFFCGYKKLYAKDFKSMTKEWSKADAKKQLTIKGIFFKEYYLYKLEDKEEPRI